MRVYGWKCAVAARWCVAMALVLAPAVPAHADTIMVTAGGDLQAALNAARPGDTILLQEGAEFVGTFLLPAKGTGDVITLRSSAPDSLLPGPGVRITPAHAPLLARLRSGSSLPALRTAPGTTGWRLEYLEFAANANGYGDLVQLGDGSSAQNTLAMVPRGITLAHLYVHGDALLGQKRCIALNAADVTIRDSHIAECKTAGQDSQAIGGWNGPGPYVIENNYIEGAGENVLFGGSDPAIQNLVADGVTFRRNHVTRPLSWRLPIIPAPGGVTAAAQTGGSLTAGTYGYRVIAYRPIGQAGLGRSTAAATVTAAVTGDGGAVRIRWDTVPHATEYRVYGRAAGAESMSWRVTATEFVDDGRAGTAGAVPTTRGSVWLVKNLFELKNARNVVVEENVFENHWKDAQPGYAIVFTPRNSGNTCGWCVIEHVRFERNVLRNVAAGFNLLGYDVPETPSQQMHDVIIRNNLVYDVRKDLGGNAWFALIGDEPRDMTIDHNTIATEGATLVNVYGGTSTAPRAVLGFTMTNNAARHGSYGMGGSYFGYGNDILANYYPGSTFLANYLAGGPSTRYPAGNYFTGLLESQVTDAAAGDFTVRADSLLRARGTDGLDIGADAAALATVVQEVVAGRGAPGAVPPVAAFTIDCSGLTCAMADASTDADGAINSWAWTFGDGGTATLGSPSHTFAAAGTYLVTLTVTDRDALTATAAETITVAAPNRAPSAAMTVACNGLACTFTDASVDPDGAIAARRWSFGDGAVSTAPSGTHRFAAAGLYEILLEVTDDRGATARAATTVALTRRAHLGGLAGTVTTWKRYWSTDIVVRLHDDDEAPVPGATLAFAWTGAVTKTASCVTDAAGECTVRSGTLSNKRTTVTVTVTNISAPGHTYGAEANHDVPGPGASITMTPDTTPAGDPVDVAAPSAHVAGFAGTITTWNTYWSTDMVVTVHDERDQPLAGATVSGSWTEAVVKVGSCVTGTTGQCTLRSGTLSGKRPSVTLALTDVSAAARVYAPGANHGVTAPTPMLTLYKPQ